MLILRIVLFLAALLFVLPFTILCVGLRDDVFPLKRDGSIGREAQMTPVATSAVLVVISKLF